MCTIRVTAAVLVVNGNRRMDNVASDYTSSYKTRLSTNDVTNSLDTGKEK